MNARRWWLVALASVALVLIVGRALAAIYVDYEWYNALGAAAIWRAKALYIVILKTVSGLAGAAFIFANLYAVRHSVVSLRFPRRLANLEIAEEVPGRYLVASAAALSLLLGALVTIPTEQWTSLALTQINIPFSEAVSYFGSDLGFFVYWLPFETVLFVWSLFATLLVSAVVVFLYALTPSLRWERGALYVSNYVRRHFTVLGTIVMIIVAWSLRLDAYNYYVDGHGAGGAFSYVDQHASVQADLVLSAGLIGAAITVLIAGWQGHVRMALVTVAVSLVLCLVVRKVAPALTWRLAKPGEIATRDISYLQTRGDYSRRAYAVDRIVAGDAASRFASTGEAARGVSLWDPATLVRAAVQQRRGAVPWVGWSGSAAGLMALLPQRPAPNETTRATWQVARILATTVDGRGEPVHALGSGTITSEDALVAPVLVHDSAGGVLLVADSLDRVAAPRVSGTLARIAAAWSLQNLRLFFGDAPSPNPKLISRRDVRDRLDALVPFFEQGSNEFPVVVGDTLWWVVDLYSASTRYPLSHHVSVPLRGEFSYFQHSATALVNATTGRVQLVSDGQLDPVARSWVREFPSVFETWARVPAALAAAIPPAIDAIHAQADIVARYGMGRDALRAGQVAWNDGADDLLTAGGPPLMLVGSGRTARLALSDVSLDSAGRVVGAVVGTGGPEHLSHWVPLARPGPSWGALSDQLHRASDSASQTTAREPKLVRGRIRAVPVGNGLVFVQPTYFWPADGSPSLARVAAMDRDRVLTGVTLADALGAPNGTTSDSLLTASPGAFRGRVQALYAQMRAALRAGDWLAFGRAYEALGALLGAPRAQP
ncbi:MAG: UPF0182 family protein [Gemmatimonadota bacterium]|nr:UPF0182 family protein [Gemmatimonadota bacterium]